MNRVIKLIHGEAAYRQGITGKDIPIAVLDTGAFPHLAIKDRIVSFKDYQQQKKIPYDDNGHGTHVLGIIGGDLSAVRFNGIAPGCLFHVYKILNKDGNGRIQLLIDAIWDIISTIEHTKVRIINISVGVSKVLHNDDVKRLNYAIDEAWKRGVVIVAAAGNNGPEEGTVTLPGINKRIITVGCFDDKLKGYKNGLKNGYSGVGPTKECIIKPEILVPGTNIKSCGNRSEQDFCIKSGTSMATPVVTGMIALLLEKYPNMSPDEVKLKVCRCARALEESRYCCGYLMADDLLT